ncbi:MAG TPA: hypothetical protein VHY81_06905, partial [Acidimicrobiales bacterium]|nr:hypothetical protein [Acidimicrobiales bacterium]
LLRTVTSGTDAGHNGATAVAVETETAATAAPVSEPVADVVETPAVESRRQRRSRTRRPRVSGKAVLTVALLLVLATAVTLVLLQSAGVIDWGFLGPTA